MNASKIGRDNKSSAAGEAARLNIRVISLMSSDCARFAIAYPIPANDASRETLSVILDEIAKTYAENLAPAPSTGSGQVA